jgi:hypothetical protein
VRPYDEDALLPYERVHAELPAEELDPSSLHPTQQHLVIDRLLAANYEGPDPAIHVVEYDGVFYVHNGHHRWMRDLLTGRQSWCRVQSVGDMS